MIKAIGGYRENQTFKVMRKNGWLWSGADAGNPAGLIHTDDPFPAIPSG